MGEIARHRLLPATDGVRPLFPPLRGSFGNSPFILCAGPRRINAGGLKALLLETLSRDRHGECSSFGRSPDGNENGAAAPPE